ncbi:hypothetical protein M758_2G111200 [Ceratodon purpureus]|nr:hypothetical protein M758_2G111200 [Ceratodon purpureus]KAG0626211.1 hypothetical protein M758_2G111200 [Ceratodon purpureus]
MSGEDRVRGVYGDLGRSFEHIVSEQGKVVKYALERWDDTYKLQIGRAEQKRIRVIDAKTELYRMVSLYILFQGVVLTTVVKASNLKCHNSFAPALFSALVYIAAIFGLRDRLLFYYDTKSALRSEEATANMTMRKITYVLSKGGDFKFDAMDNDLQPPLQDPPLEDPGDGENRPLLGVGVNQESIASTGTPQRRFQRDPEKYYWHIMAFVSLFSAFVIINCFIILCIE